jgi:hypothetical protein
MSATGVFPKLQILKYIVIEWASILFPTKIPPDCTANHDAFSIRHNQHGFYLTSTAFYIEQHLHFMPFQPRVGSKVNWASALFLMQIIAVF